MTRFLITIDVECDNAWARGASVTTNNAEYLPGFQALCEEFDFKPSYLVNHEMADCPAFQRFGRDVMDREAGEIGMHLHAWNSPPIVDLTGSDMVHHPYLVEYPEPVMRDKIELMTQKLEDVFGAPAKSHRAGRWALDERYARLLVEYGYQVDCSVTPFVSWRHKKGRPDGNGGADYRGFPSHPYFLDLDDIRRQGDSPLLEVPMTIVPDDGAIARLVRRAAAGVPRLRTRVRQRRPELLWLRPNGANRGAMIRALRKSRRSGAPCVEFMLHSSEFMPGGSPTFRDGRAIERLFADMRAVFRYASEFARGCTLSEFRREWQGS